MQVYTADLPPLMMNTLPFWGSLRGLHVTVSVDMQKNIKAYCVTNRAGALYCDTVSTLLKNWWDDNLKVSTIVVK